MVLRYLRPEDAPDPDTLFEEGENIGGRDTAGNWTHAGIVRLSRNHGLSAYSQEFRSLTGGVPSEYEPRLVEQGLVKIARSIRAGTPVIASIVRRGGMTPHTAVVIGKTNDGFVIHDPDAENEEDGKSIIMSIDEFRIIWRKFAIFFEP
jgi:hypothetical protein